MLNNKFKDRESAHWSKTYIHPKNTSWHYKCRFERKMDKNLKVNEPHKLKSAYSISRQKVQGEGYNLEGKSFYNYVRHG